MRIPPPPRWPEPTAVWPGVEHDRQLVLGDHLVERVRHPVVGEEVLQARVELEAADVVLGDQPPRPLDALRPAVRVDRDERDQRVALARGELEDLLVGHRAAPADAVDHEADGEHVALAVERRELGDGEQRVRAEHLGDGRAPASPPGSPPPRIEAWTCVCTSMAFSLSRSTVALMARDDSQPEQVDRRADDRVRVDPDVAIEVVDVAGLAEVRRRRARRSASRRIADRKLSVCGWPSSTATIGAARPAGKSSSRIASSPSREALARLERAEHEVGRR